MQAQNKNHSAIQTTRSVWSGKDCLGILSHWACQIAPALPPLHWKLSPQPVSCRCTWVLHPSHHKFLLPVDCTPSSSLHFGPFFTIFSSSLCAACKAHCYACSMNHTYLGWMDAQRWHHMQQLYPWTMMGPGCQQGRFGNVSGPNCFPFQALGKAGHGGRNCYLIECYGDNWHVVPVCKQWHDNPTCPSSSGLIAYIHISNMFEHLGTIMHPHQSQENG